LYAFDSPACAESGGACSPTWTGATTGGIYAAAAAGDLVYASTAGGTIYAFPQFCSYGGGACSPVWRGSTPSYIRTPPVVVDGRLYTTSQDGRLYMFDRSAVSGSAEPGPPDPSTLRPDRSLPVRRG